jgi:very-long-chain ceramide synthase
MRFVFRPLFHRLAPKPTDHTATRFAEQAWSAASATVSFSAGLYIALNSPYWRDLNQLWAGYPQRESDGFFKAYYLLEIAFWVQQVIVLNIEEKRKDFWQMLFHHFITCTLIFLSYTYNLSRPGNVILCIMDPSDILLSVIPLVRKTKFRRRKC